MGVSFNEDKRFPVVRRNVKRSMLVSLAYATGLARNDREAQCVLLGVFGLCLLLMFYVLFFKSSNSFGQTNQRPSPAELQSMSNLPTR